MSIENTEAGVAWMSKRRYFSGLAVLTGVGGDNLDQISPIVHLPGHQPSCRLRFLRMIRIGDTQHG